MADCLVIVYKYLAVSLCDQLVVLLAPQLILKLLCIKKLCCLVILNSEESWVGYRFRRRQKFALILQEFSVGDPWRVGLFILDTFYHLVKIKGY